MPVGRMPRMPDNQYPEMHLALLVNEGTVAVGVMAVAMSVAFLMVVGLGAYVLYCDAENRAGERALAEGHGETRGEAAAEAHAGTAGGSVEADGKPAPHRAKHG